MVEDAERRRGVGRSVFFVGDDRFVCHGEFPSRGKQPLAEVGALPAKKEGFIEQAYLLECGGSDEHARTAEAVDRCASRVIGPREGEAGRYPCAPGLLPALWCRADEQGADAADRLVGIRSGDQISERIILAVGVVVDQPDEVERPAGLLASGNGMLYPAVIAP
jgi:hypothetical protein